MDRIYAVFHEESEPAVRIDQFLHPEEKIKKNQPNKKKTPDPFVFLNVLVPRLSDLDETRSK